MTKTVTVENINGVDFTVIRKPFDAKWVKEQLRIGMPVMASTFSRQLILHSYDHNTFNGIDSDEERDRLHPDEYEVNIVTILPPLPCQPKPEDVPLLYRYMSYGLRPFATALTATGKPTGTWCGLGVIEAAEASRNMEIKYTFDTSDKRVEVAIKEDE